MTGTTRRSLLRGAAAFGLAAPFVSKARIAWASDDLTIGVVTPLSGPQEMIGSFVRIGAEIAADHVNKNGGVGGRQIRLEFRDSKVNPSAAAVAARELIGDGVNLQLGTISSSVALAMGPLLEQEGGVVMTCGAGSEKINHENYSPNVFRVGDSPYSRQMGLVRLMAERHPEVKSWGGLIPDHEYGRTTWALFVHAMKTVWPEVTGEQAELQEPILVPYGAGDYKSFIGQAMRQPIQGLYTSVYGGDAVTLYQQATPFGLFKKVPLLLDSANEFLAAKALKAQTPDHWTGIHWYYEANKGNPLSDQLYAGYVERTGDKWPMGWATEAHAAILAYAAAVPKASSTDTEAVIGALKGLTFDSATGKRTLRAEDNQAVKNAEAIRIVPDQGAADGFKVADYVSFPGESVIEPPRPGEPMELQSM